MVLPSRGSNVHALIRGGVILVDDPHDVSGSVSSSKRKGLVTYRYARVPPRVVKARIPLASAPVGDGLHSARTTGVVAVERSTNTSGTSEPGAWSRICMHGRSYGSEPRVTAAEGLTRIPVEGTPGGATPRITHRGVGGRKDNETVFRPVREGASGLEGTT